MRRKLLLPVFVALVVFPFSCSVDAQTSSAAPISNQQLLNKVESYLRVLFAWSADYNVDVGPSKPSPIAGLDEVPVKVTYQGKSQTGTVYVTSDGKYMFRGEIRNMAENPFAANLAKLTVANSPSLGPADAKVTVVIFSDFECPHCMELHEILKTVVPEFPQVRFVFKDFPLVDIHPWAMTAATAARCTYDASPQSYWKIDDAIFANQDIISADNVWSELTDFAGSAGVSSDALHACMVSPQTKAAVEADIAEGKSLAVDSTPTLFINGRPLVGGDRETLEQIIRYELARSKS